MPELWIDELMQVQVRSVSYEFGCSHLEQDRGENELSSGLPTEVGQYGALLPSCRLTQTSKIILLHLGSDEQTVPGKTHTE